MDESMRVYGILEGVVDSAIRICDPALRMVHVCESGFVTEDEAAQSLIDDGWINHYPSYIAMTLGNDVWLRPLSDEREKDEDGFEVEQVRYIFEMEVDDAVS
jgi:hypothetical protein